MKLFNEWFTPELLDQYLAAGILLFGGAIVLIILILVALFVKRSIFSKGSTRSNYSGTNIRFDKQLTRKSNDKSSKK